MFACLFFVVGVVCTVETCVWTVLYCTVPPMSKMIDEIFFSHCLISCLRNQLDMIAANTSGLRIVLRMVNLSVGSSFLTVAIGASIGDCSSDFDVGLDGDFSSFLNFFSCRISDESENS